MSYEKCASDPKKRRTPVFSVIEPLFEIMKRAARKQISHLPSDRGRQSFLQSRSHQVRHALRGLERNVTHESVRHDDIHFAVVNVAALNIPDKVNRQLFQQRVRLARKFVTFAFFFTRSE